MLRQSGRGRRFRRRCRRRRSLLLAFVRTGRRWRVGLRVVFALLLPLPLLPRPLTEVENKKRRKSPSVAHRLVVTTVHNDEIQDSFLISSSHREQKEKKEKRVKTGRKRRKTSPSIPTWKVPAVEVEPGGTMCNVKKKTTWCTLSIALEKSSFAPSSSSSL